MAVYKEGYSIVNSILRNSKQVYPDAADYGVLVKKGDSNWNGIKQLVEWYGVKGTREETRYSTGSSVLHKVMLMDEWAVSDGIKTETQATEYYMVSYVTLKDKPGYDGLVTIWKVK
jgi:hypothetical protein